MSLEERTPEQEEKEEELQGIGNRPILGTYHQAPKFLRDNEYILTGYRINHNTITRILRSLFMLHNESINVWSHLIGVGVFTFLIAYIAINLSQKIIVPTFNKITYENIHMLLEGILFNSKNITYKVFQYICNHINILPLFSENGSKGSMSFIEYQLPKCTYLTQGR